MKEKYIDLIGMYAAILCLIHCLLAPLLFLFSIGISHNGFIDLAFLCVGGWPVYRIIRGSAPFYLKALVCISLILIATSIVMEMLFHVHTILIFIGAFGLIVGHLINFRSHKHC
ncbi:MerC domain-containing protein [Galbibacter sp. PAP.153]|uniref:MerC domain-containing protein n=1 Tax=Galbibacter sp. PAP.153 TaxID=3104623 RepID=UPI00300AC85A